MTYLFLVEVTQIFMLSKMREVTTTPPVVCSKAYTFNIKQNVEEVDTFIIVCAADDRRRNGVFYAKSIGGR